MCAIFGYGGFHEPSLLERMENSLVHRGPDGGGQFETPNFSMGARRLAIIDLHTGDQPLYNENRNLVLTFNGEIYNYKEIRAELLEKGHTFGTGNDGEVIVHGWEEWGEKILDRLNGMFAFALWDNNKEELFMARDRCGQKPLYLYTEGTKLLFASEIKAILNSAQVSRQPNIETIDSYLALRYVPEPQTMFQGIVTLPAAHHISWTPGKGITQPVRYWSIQANQVDETISLEEAAEKLDHLLNDSVKLCLRSDVPVASYLSGGVDSGLLAALAKNETPDLYTYSVGFGSKIDETADALETSKHIKTNHHQVQCGIDKLKALPDIVKQMDRPVGDGLIIAFDELAENVSKDFKVVLSGEGVDEIFAGYSFQKVMKQVNDLLPLGVSKPLSSLINTIPVSILNRFFQFPAQLGNTGKQRLVEFLKGVSAKKIDTSLLRTVWSEDERNHLYSSTIKDRLDTKWRDSLKLDRGNNFLNRLLKSQWDEWLQDWSLIRQDKNAMAHSLEVRIPFLDHRLIKYGFQLPDKLKISGKQNKAIFRAVSEKYLPKTVSNRAKVPFYFPAEMFIQSPTFRELINQTLAESIIKKRGYFDSKAIEENIKRMYQGDFLVVKQIMSLIILELWHQEFMD